MKTVWFDFAFTQFLVRKRTIFCGIFDPIHGFGLDKPNYFQWNLLVFCKIYINRGLQNHNFSPTVVFTFYSFMGLTIFYQKKCFFCGEGF